MTTNVIEQAINSDNGARAAKIIQEALGIESDHMANYCFPKDWPTDSEKRAVIIAEWLKSLLLLD